MTTDTKLAEVMAQLRAALDARPTPGLWQQPYKLTGRFGIYNGDGKPIAKVEREADAKLIASANPEAIRTILDALEAAQADARRYRWLCEQDHADVAACWIVPGKVKVTGPLSLKQQLDAAIDAAIAETQPSSELAPR